MIGIIVAVIIGILLIGLVLKIVKFAVIAAIVIGVLLVAQNKFGNKRIR